MEWNPLIDKKIYFIFSQKGENNSPIKLEENELVHNIKLIIEEKKGEYSYVLYSLDISSSSQEKNITLFLTYSNEKYFTSLEWDRAYPAIFLYKVDFKPFNKNIANNLNQFIMSYREQFIIFKKHIVSQNNELFKDLCLSTLDYIHNVSLINQNQKNIIFEFDFFLYLFIGCLFLYNENKDENLLNKYFNEFNNDLIDAKNSFNRNDSSRFLIEEIINKDFLNSLDDYTKINNDIKSMSKNNEIFLIKLDLILAYYYFNYKPKLFIKFISKKNERSKEVNSHLMKNRKVFNDFSAEIMDFYIFDETENLEEIQNLFELMPNLVEVSKVLSIEILYEKMCYLEQIENKVFNMAKIIKPNKSDNIEVLSQNIKNLFKLQIQNNHLTFSLSKEFFMGYCEIFYQENLRYLEILIDIFLTYQSFITSKDEEMKEELYNCYKETGIYLIHNGKIVNRDALNYIEKINKFFKEKVVFPDEIYNSIVPSNDKEFINDFLNGKFSLGNDFGKFVKGFFNNFKTVKDFNNLVKWENKYCRDGEVYNMCFESFTNLLIKEKENKLSKELIKFLADLIIIISRKKITFIDQLIEIEQKFNNPKLFLEIFAEIVKLKEEKPYSLLEYIYNYIQLNCKKEDPMSIYYKLLTIENKVSYLVQNLEAQYAIKVQDFYNYPNEIEDRILLFINLYTERYFYEYASIRELEYYKKSMTAKDCIKSAKYKDAINMYKNINSLRALFLYFLPNRFNEENDYIIDILIIDFYELFESCKGKYDSLKLVLNYWKHFFNIMKKGEIDGLEKFLNELENTALEDFTKLETNMNSFLVYEDKAKNNDKLFNSFFFMGLYRESSSIFPDNEEEQKFQYVLMRFDELKSLGNNSNIEALNPELLNKLTELVYKNKDRLEDELIFIKEYFHFDSNENNNYNFDINKIKIDFDNRVSKYKKSQNLDDYQFEFDDFSLIKNPTSNLNSNNFISNKNFVKTNEDEDSDFNLLTNDGNEGFTLLDDDKDEEENNNKIKEEEFLQREIDKVLLEEKQKKELLQDLNQMSYDYYYIYRINNSSDIDYLQENIKFEENFLKFFWESFKNIRKYDTLSNLDFYKDVISLMTKIFLSSVGDNYFKKEDNIKNSDIYLIYEFYDILEFYKKYQLISNKPYIYDLIEKLIQCKESSNRENINIIQSFDNLFESIKEKFQDKNINTLFIKILIQEKLKNDNDEFNMPLLDLIFRKENKPLLNNSIPLLDKIIKEEIESNMNLEEDRMEDFEWNNITINIIEKKYKDTKDKDLEELILYYFESKLTFLFNKYKIEIGENEIYQNEKMKEYLNRYLNILEQISRKEYNQRNILLTTLFCIAFVKCFLNNYIYYLYEHNQELGDMSDINKNIIKGEGTSPFRTSLKLYVLKLFFRIFGNYNDFIKFNYNNYQIDYFSNKDIKTLKDDTSDLFLQLNKTEKYGFDYLFIKFNDIEFNEFMNIENNLYELGKNELDEMKKNSLISLINNCYNLDNFICAFINIFLSKFQYKDYFQSDEYKNINNWMYDCLNNNKFYKMNNILKELLLLFIDNKRYENKILKIEENMTYGSLSYNHLLSFLFSLRFVFITLLYSNQNNLYYQIITNGKIILNKYNNYFNYYNKNFETYENRQINNLTFSIIRFIIISHLYFGYLLGYIDLNDINSHFFNNKNELRMMDLLEQEFDFIKTILSLIGIQSIIVFINYIFNDIISIIINISTITDEMHIIEIERDIENKINKYCDNFDYFLEKYHNLTNQIKNNDYKSEFKKIIFEDKELYNSNDINNRYSFISYFTITNFSSINDFENQFKYLINDKNNYPMINCILNDSEIIKLSNILPVINSFINEVNNELILKIKKNDMDKKIDDFNLSIENFDDKIEEFNNKIKEIKKLKSFSNIEINEINRNSKISEIINIKDNSINKLFDTMINVYNEFLTNSKIYNNNKNLIEPIIIQNASQNDYINFIIKKDDVEISPKEKLQEIISLYSKRNRYTNKLLNTYNGSKIIYDFKEIESLLQKEYLYGKRPFLKEQRTFIFSNELFSEERSNLLENINKKYPQKEINELCKKNIEKFFNSQNRTKDNDLQIYNNIRYIIIYLVIYDKNNYDAENISVEYISKIMKKANYQFNDEFIDFLDKFKQNINLSNLLYLLNNIENTCFKYLTEEITRDIKDNKINININKEKNSEITEYYKNDKLLLNEDVMINSIKRYILRYYIEENQNEKDFINAITLENILNKSDIWEDKIYKDEKFKEENNNLLKLNENNCLMKYFFNKLFELKELKNEINENKNEIKEEIKNDINGPITNNRKFKKKRKINY